MSDATISDGTGEATPLGRWKHRVDEVPERGLAVERTATPEECAALARALDILGCRSLEVRYRLTAAGGGRYRLKGTLDAVVEQACIVTLDPVEGRISEPLDEEFRPPSDTLPSADGEAAEQGALDAETYETISAQGTLDVGRVLYEHIATTLDPYPRRSDAAFEFAPSEADARAASPFAALSGFKPRK